MTKYQPSTPPRNEVDQQRRVELPIELYVDVHSILRRLGNDRELLNELIDIYLDDMAPLIAQLNAAIDTRDPDRAVRAAHSIKGLASNFGETPVTLAALRLERHALARAWDELRPCLDELADHASALRCALLRLRDGRPA